MKKGFRFERLAVAWETGYVHTYAHVLSPYGGKAYTHDTTHVATLYMYVPIIIL